MAGAKAGSRGWEWVLQCSAVWGVLARWQELKHNQVVLGYSAQGDATPGQLEPKWPWARSPRVLHVECSLMGQQELKQVWAWGSRGTPCREYPDRMTGAKTDASQEVSGLSALRAPWQDSCC